MTYCTEAQVTALTGTTIASATITTILAECDREINTLLGKYGFSSGSGDEITTAAGHMMKALLTERGLLTGDIGSSTGDLSTSGRGIADALHYRKLAETAISVYAIRNPAQSTRRRIYQMNRT